MTSKITSPLILITLIFILIIIVRFLFYFSAEPSFEAGGKVEIVHTFMETANISNFNQYFYVENILISLPLHPKYSYGDKIELKGIVEERISRKNDKVTTSLIIDDPEVKKVDDNVLSLLSFIRQKIINSFKSVLPPKEAGLMAGIVLGADEGINDEFKEQLKDTGILHVVVASGSNVVLVAGLIFALGSSFLNKRNTVFITILGIFIYALLSGFDSPIVRASIMASFAFGALLLGRQKIAIVSLLFAAWVMLMISPRLISDIGFQLSFSATLGIMLFQRAIITFSKVVPNIIKEDFATTLSAQLGAMPFLIVAFGEINLLSVFTNVVLLWTVPIIMIFGLVFGVISLILPLIAFPFLLLMYPLLAFFSNTVEASSNFYIPLSLTSAALPIAIVYYIFVVWILMKRREI